MKTAHQVGTDVYARLGYDLRDLGCLMLNTSNPVTKIDVDPDSTYTSPDPKKFWVKGLLEDWHVTLRYGFLPGVTRADVDDVLQGVSIPSYLPVDSTELFPSPYHDEKYDCLVARVDTSDLARINNALSVLPNINTFPQYKAHITIGYFKPGLAPTLTVGEGLAYTVATEELNYGHNL